MARVMPWITGVSLISMIWSGVWRDASFVAMLSIASTVVAVLLESCSPSCAKRADTVSRVSTIFSVRLSSVSPDFLEASSSGLPAVTANFFISPANLSLASPSVFLHFIQSIVIDSAQARRCWPNRSGIAIRAGWHNTAQHLRFPAASSAERCCASVR